MSEQHNTQAQSKKRRRRRFGLRTLFIATTLICIFIGRWSYLSNEQEKAVAELRRLGHVVKYEHEPPSVSALFGRKPAQPSIRFPEWLVKTLGQDWFYAVSEIRFFETSVPDDNEQPPFELLRNLRHIRKIYCVGTINSFEELSHLSQLKELIFQHCKIESFVGLENNTRLQSILSWDNSRICSFKGLGKCKALRRLDAYYVDDLTPLKGCTGLEELRVTESSIDDISPLAKCTKLKSVTLFCSKRVTDLAPVSKLNSLQGLFLRGAHISDLAPIKNQNIAELVLMDCDLSNLKGIEQMPSLKELDVRGNKIKDFLPLKECQRLKSAQCIWHHLRLTTNEIQNQFDEIREARPGLTLN